jgi:hypothetical protein
MKGQAHAPECISFEWLDIERPDIEIAIALSKILCSGQGIIQHHPGAINEL